MNEIDPQLPNINKIASVHPDTRQNKSKEKENASFDQILADQVNTGEAKKSAGSSVTLPEIEGSFHTRHIGLAQMKTQGSQKLTDAISLLETYAAWLGNPDKTLRQAYELLEQVSAQTKTIEQDFQTDKTTPADLKQILNHLITTIEVEQVKFDRGDYT